MTFCFRVLPRPVLPFLTSALTVAATFVAATPALAQSTREDAITPQQEEKATRLQPYQPDALERRLTKLDGLMTQKRAVYAFIGSVYEGTGFAVGPGYRSRRGESGTFTAHAAVSFQGATGLHASYTLPPLSRDRVTVGTHANWIDVPRVAFYGVGNDTAKDERTTFEYSAKTAGAFTRVHLGGPLTVGGALDWMALEATPDATIASTNSPTYMRSQVFAQVDTRPATRYTRRGGLYRVDLSNYQQTNEGRNTFTRVDAEARHFFPVLRENWVIAVRALASATSTPSGDQVPYFLLPDLGGGSTLRGYSTWRFRDRSRLLFSGEYRWTAGSFVDMALFMDAGKVARSVSHFNEGRFTKSYGVGVTLHTVTKTVTRVELARTSEGTAVLFSFGPSF